jgi:hypothetical protein
MVGMDLNFKDFFRLPLLDLVITWFPELKQSMVSQ